MIRVALQQKGWRARDLQHALADRGLAVTTAAISLWANGGTISDRYRIAVSELLGLDFADLSRALAAQAADRLSA